MSRFIHAASLAEALAALASGQGRVLAGGTDLMVALRAARLSGGELPAELVDVAAVPELQQLELEGPAPLVGAGLSFARLAADPGVRARYPLLAQAAASVGSPQVRHRATIGGNVANASPAADGVTALAALGAVAVIASAQGQRRCPLGELISAPYQTTLRPQELILGLALDPLPARTGQVFAKVGRRQALSVARLNLAVCLDERLQDPRLALGACFPTPRRLAEVEALLRAGRPGPALWRAAGAQAADHFTDVCGWRESAAYKVPAIRRVTARTLAQAWALLGGEA
ncbi:MAG: FAD binding domain-containing protein [Thermodesulfobacteriota bacterium]